MWKLLCGTLILAATISDARAQVPGISPDTLSTVIQNGGTAALLLFMFWLLREERKKSEKLEDERVAMVKEMLSSMHDSTTALAESAKVQSKMGEGVEKLTFQLDILLKKQGP